MKVLFVTLLLVAAAFGAAIQQDTMAEGPRCPIADPLEIEQGAINTTLVYSIIGIDEGSVQDGATANGLSTVYYKIDINVLLFTATFEASIDKADIVGKGYSATGEFNLEPFSSLFFPSGTILGSGPFSGSITNGKVAGKATLFANIINQKLSCTKLTIDTLEFDDIKLNLGDLMVGDIFVDFDTWNAGFKAAFELEFPEHNEYFFNTRVRQEVINAFLKQYTIAELLEMIGDGGGTPAPCATTPSSIF